MFFQILKQKLKLHNIFWDQCWYSNIFNNNNNNNNNNSASSVYD